MTNNHFTLFCLVDGEPQSNAFPVSTSATATVGELKDLIKTKKTPRFNDIAADELILWRVSIPDDDDGRIALIEEVSEKSKLKATTKLSKVFDSEIAEDTIHILVRCPPPAPQPSKAQVDPIVTFDVTINGHAPKTLKWTTTPNTATLDHLRQVIYEQHPSLRDRSRTIVYEDENNDVPGYLLFDYNLRSHVSSKVQQHITNLTLRLEDPPKLFSDITSDDTFRLYGIYVDPPQPFDESRSPPITSEKHTQALDNLYVTLEVAVASMAADDSTLLGSRHYSNAFFMHAVALFPELRVRLGKKLRGLRACGNLDYAIEVQEDPSCMLAVTMYEPSDCVTGVAQNVVQLDTISEIRKRKRNDDDDNEVAPIVSYGIATDSRDWFLQQVTIDKPQKIGYNFPTIHSSRIPTSLDFTKDRAQWRADAKEIFRHVVSHIQKVVDAPPQCKRTKVES